MGRRPISRHPRRHHHAAADRRTTLISLTKDNATYPQMSIGGAWIQDYPDPQNWLSVYWTCDSTFAKGSAIATRNSTH